MKAGTWLGTFFLTTSLVLLYLIYYLSITASTFTFKQGKGYIAGRSEHWKGFTIPAENVCHGPGSDDIYLVTVINSAIENFEKRQVIRDTWASEAYKSGNRGRFRVAFILGASNNSETTRWVTKESALHRDIIKMDVIDHYKNLTHKVLAILRWVAEECPFAQYLLKTDDDMYINIPNIFRILEMIPGRKNIMFGYLMSQTLRYKSPEDKWYIPDSQYSKDTLPDFLSGTAYVMPSDVASRVHGLCHNETAFTMEDVLVTGICAEKLGIKRFHAIGFNQDALPSTGCDLRNAISSHRVPPEEMRKIWEELQNPRLECYSY